MKLLDRVVSNLGDREKAEAGLGIVFMIVRLTLKPDQYRVVLHAISEADVWVRKSVSTNASRTGEMFALIAPDTIAPRLHKVGYSDAEARMLGEAVAEALAEVMDPAAWEALTASIPLLTPAAA